MFDKLNPLELRGPDFLLFYGMLVILVLVITQFLRMWKMSRHENDLPVDELKDPLNLAVMAGGENRMLLTVLMMLKAANTVRFLRTSQGWRCKAGSRPNTDNRELLVAWEQIAEYGEEGCRLDAIHWKLKPLYQIRSQELALLGLRPVSKDYMKLKLTGSLLFLGLMILGISKVVVGLERSRPVGFLVVGLILTGLLWKFFMEHTPNLTAKGERLLSSTMEKASRLHIRNRIKSITEPLSDSERIVLLGTGVAMYNYSFLQGMGLYDIADFAKEHFASFGASSGWWEPSSKGSGGVGCSGSGCSGGSGCGGGGCGGGCGGCGGCGG